MILLIKTDVVYPLFLYANGLMPTYRLKYLPKNDVLAKLSELEILHNEMGKPYFSNYDLHFNLTHSGGFVVLALYSSTEVNIWYFEFLGIPCYIARLIVILYHQLSEVFVD